MSLAQHCDHENDLQKYDCDTPLIKFHVCFILTSLSLNVIALKWELPELLQYIYRLVLYTFVLLHVYLTSDDIGLQCKLMIYVLHYFSLC